LIWLFSGRCHAFHGLDLQRVFVKQLTGSFVDDNFKIMQLLPLGEQSAERYRQSSVGQVCER
jgi:hypothetical protein